MKVGHRLLLKLSNYPNFKPLRARLQSHTTIHDQQDPSTIQKPELKLYSPKNCCGASVNVKAINYNPTITGIPELARQTENFGNFQSKFMDAKTVNVSSIIEATILFQYAFEYLHRLNQQNLF